MRIVLAMVGVSLGLTIAVVAGVYGWQRYEESKPVPPLEPVASAPAQVASPAEPVSVPEPVKPTSGGLAAPTPPRQPATALPPPAVAPTPAPKPVTPAPAAPITPPAQIPTSPPKQLPPTLAGAPGVSGGDDQAIATPMTEGVATPEKLEALQIGMTEGDVRQTMGVDGIETSDEQLPEFTPQGWYELRWANPDGSYIAATFNEEGTLTRLQPFNLPGAYAWLATPHYAIPAWLNEKLQANNMLVRLPAVDVVEPRQYTYQFRGGLVDATGATLGMISGTYYVGEAAGQYARAIEGTYEYRLPDGRADANTFQFVE